MLPLTDDYQELDIEKFIQGLEDGPIDSAGFAAGVLYSATKQYVDRRDYIAECSYQDDALD